MADSPFNDIEDKPLPTILNKYGMITNQMGQALYGDFIVGNKATGSVKIDGPNNRFIISDAANPRIVIGEVT